MTIKQETEFKAYLAAGRTAVDAARLAGYSRPVRAAERLLGRVVNIQPEPDPLDPATRLERTLQRLDQIVSRGEDRDAVSAARPLLEEAKKIVETQQAKVWIVSVDNGRGPVPEASPQCFHVYADKPETIDAVIAAILGTEAGNDRAASTR